MTSKSTLDPDNFPTGSRHNAAPRGHGVRSLGPSDSSDSGSDLAGALPNTGDALHLERGADEDSLSGHASDIDTDRIVGAEEAGLGGGLDQAEEAQLGVRDDDGSASSDDRLSRIAKAAYYRAQRRGFEGGSKDEDWLEAEREVDAER